MANKKSFFQYVGKTPIIPIGIKILTVFVCLLLLSNFATNFINIQMNRAQVIRLTNTLLVNRLKEIYTIATNQFEIYKYSQKSSEAVEAIFHAAEKGFDMPHSIALGAYPDGTLFFSASTEGNIGFKTISTFTDEDALASLESDAEQGIMEGSINFTMGDFRYLGVYKYHDDWKCYFMRAEALSDMNRQSNIIFARLSIFIVLLTIVFLVLGFLMFNRILRNIRRITESLYSMQGSQKLGLLNLDGAPNDDITYLGASFNALSSTINNLLNIFRKFVSRDVVTRAYSDHEIRLEGAQKELTILFSDIRGFTYMTETLGNDIINLLNIHYDRVIKEIHRESGIVGSIIGDAVLAVWGTMEEEDRAVLALNTAWEIVRVTSELREKMKERRTSIEKTRSLTAAEKRVFKAVLVDVGVGIDGGTVFYGNIGSVEHMANTVIGDNVNSAARLEGLTRLYNLPVIVSKYIKDEVLAVSQRYVFYEIDTVQVRGKTIGKKIFFPLDTQKSETAYIQHFNIYQEALEAYYKGDWEKAAGLFRSCKLDCAQVILSRISGKTAPARWRGTWTITTK